MDDGMVRHKVGNEEGQIKYSIRGQRAEEPLLHQFFEVMKNEADVVSLYRTGLVVGSIGSYVRDSPDAVLIQKTLDDHQCMPSLSR